MIDVRVWEKWMALIVSACVSHTPPSPCSWSACWPPADLQGSCSAEALLTTTHSTKQHQSSCSGVSSRRARQVSRDLTLPMSSLSNTGFLGREGGDGIRVLSAVSSGSDEMSPAPKGHFFCYSWFKRCGNSHHEVTYGKVNIKISKSVILV